MVTGSDSDLSWPYQVAPYQPHEIPNIPRDLVSVSALGLAIDILQARRLATELSEEKGLVFGSLFSPFDGYQQASWIVDSRIRTVVDAQGCQEDLTSTLKQVLETGNAAQIPVRDLSSGVVRRLRDWSVAFDSEYPYFLVLLISTEEGHAVFALAH